MHLQKWCNHSRSWYYFKYKPCSQWAPLKFSRHWHWLFLMHLPPFSQGGSQTLTQSWISFPYSGNHWPFWHITVISVSPLEYWKLGKQVAVHCLDNNFIIYHLLYLSSPLSLPKDQEVIFIRLLTYQNKTIWSCGVLVVDSGKVCSSQFGNVSPPNCFDSDIHLAWYIFLHSNIVDHTQLQLTN